MPTREQIKASAARSFSARSRVAKKESKSFQKRARESEAERQKLTDLNATTSIAGDKAAEAQRLQTSSQRLSQERAQESQRLADEASGLRSNKQNLQFGEQLKSEIADRQAFEQQGKASPFRLEGKTADGISSTAEDVIKGIGGISDKGATQEQQRSIDAIEKFNKAKEEDRKRLEKQTQVSQERGGITQGESVIGKDFVTSPVGEISKGAPDFLQTSSQLTGDILGTQLDVALANQKSKENLRENQLRQQLSNLSMGSDGDNLLASLEGRMGKLSLPQLESLATQNGLELTDSLRESLSREGRTAIQTEKISRDARLAENDYSKKQLSRTFDRATTEREDFNTQQDAMNRRLLAEFGGGKFSSLGGNVSVMKAAEKGQRALEDLKSEYTDKTMLVSQRADTVIATYGNNVRIIQNDMAEAQENKLAAIHKTIDDLMSEGVTNEIDLRNSIVKAKQQYAKDYFTIAEKAFNAIGKQNQQLFDNDIKLRDIQLAEKKTRQTNRFTNRFGTASTPSSNTTGMQTVQTNSQWAANCVKYAREQIPNLPFGLFTKADKQRAVQEEGFRDPSKVKVGDAVLTSEGSVGHVAIVTGIENGQLVLEEANYRAGEVTKGRLLDPNDAKIYGFIGSANAPAMSMGGNIEMEGTNESIESQIGVGEKFPQDIRDAVTEFNLGSSSRKNEIIEDARKAGVLDQFSRALEAGDAPRTQLEAQIGAFVQSISGVKDKDARKQLEKDIFNEINSGRARTSQEAKRNLGIVTTEDKEVKARISGDIKPINKDTNEILRSAKNIINLSNIEGGIGDVATIVAFLKTIDPNSVARESEVAGVETARGTVEGVITRMRKFSTGQTLGNEQRRQLRGAAEVLAEAARANLYEKLIQGKSELETERGVDATVISDFQIQQLERELGQARVDQIRLENGIAPEGELAITRNGQQGFIPEDEFNPETDQLIQ